MELVVSRNRIGGFVLCLASLLSVGCGTRANPGMWSEADIESNIKQKMDLEELDVVRSADGYTGTGKNYDGETFSLTIKQDAAASKLEYTAVGDRGTNEQGFFEVD